MTESVTLETAVIRGEQTITTVSVRKPKSGELRGLNLANVVQMDVDSLIKLLPRITTPSLTEAEVSALEPADLMQLGSKVAYFLVPKNTDYLPA